MSEKVTISLVYDRVRRTIVFATLVAIITFLGATAWWFAYRNNVMQTAERANIRLTQATDLVLAQVDKFQPMPAVLAARPDIVNMLDPKSAKDGIPDSQLLQKIADTTGAQDIFVLALDGEVIASSNWHQEHSFIGDNLAFRPYFKRALRGGLGFFHAVGKNSNRRGFFFAHAIRGENNVAIGVIAVKTDIESIETVLRADKEIVFFTDNSGVIFLANRSHLPYFVFGDSEALSKRDDVKLQYFETPFLEFPARQVSQIFGETVWANTALPDFPPTVLSRTMPVPRIGMQAHILMDLGEARTRAIVWATLFAVMGMAMWLIGLIVMQRRAAMTRQLEIEEAANARLEQRVRDRTELLSAEVNERKNAEQELKRTQAELVQASKLSALGEMSAGISHELNQPLAALQSYSENAVVFLERKDFHNVADNLGQIAKLSARMGRIIKNLRSFAHKESEAASPVDIVEIVNEALALVDGPVTKSGVSIDWAGNRSPVIVMGGRVRLQQIIVNLIANAIDAMEDQATGRSIEIKLRQVGHLVYLDLRDNGPGLGADPRIFDPFFTTKTVGAGLGLGLSISHGIAKSFGGDIRGENNAERGATFTVELVAAEIQKVAE